MSSAMLGSPSTLSRVSQAFALFKSRMTSPGRSRAPRGGPPCGTRRGCAAVSAITDRRGRITYANDNFCEISGYSRDELFQITEGDLLRTATAIPPAVARF